MLTRPIHPLETYARRVFGKRFSSVILYGLQESEEAKDVCLALERVDGTEKRLQTTLSVMKPQPEVWGLKPLVLAALFKLLLRQPVINYVLNFSYIELLNELMWPDNAPTRREVDDAIGFYFRCSYSKRVVPLVDENSSERQGSYRLITGYGHDGVIRPQSDLSNNEGYEVSFDETLIEALRKGRIVFANMSLGRLGKVSAESPSEATAEANIAGQQTPQTEYPNEPSLTKQPFRLPTTRPTVKINASPITRRSADLKPKIWARPVGETEISIDTGAIASSILRALHCASVRHPVNRIWPYKSCEAIAENVYREVDLQLRHAAYSMVKQVRRLVYEDALRHSFGLMHNKEPNKSLGERGPTSIWHSADHFTSSLLRAIEAIEFEEWKPKRQGVPLNRRWKEVHTATIKLVVAYWSEVEGMTVGQVDSSQMRKWLTSLGLPSFSTLRSELRLRITRTRSIQMELQSKENIWPYIILNGFPATIT